MNPSISTTVDLMLGLGHENRMGTVKIGLLAAIIVLQSCNQVPLIQSKNDTTYTLYRNSILDANMRIHVATFDSEEGGKLNPDYNNASCRETAELYNKYDTAGKLWWCEVGKFTD